MCAGRKPWRKLHNIESPQTPPVRGFFLPTHLTAAQRRAP
nr:MAG TPA: hypothetical protein [Caudoviricetes sp.]